MSCGTPDTAKLNLSFDYKAVTFFGSAFCLIRLPSFNTTSRSIPLAIFLWLGLGSFPFAHHYSENRFFTFFSSGYLDVSVPRVPLRTLLIHVRIPSHYQRWVPSFGNLRIDVHLQLPVAYRSLSRPSSAPSAKASTIRSSSLNRLVFKSIAFLQFTNNYSENRLISVFPQQNIILWFCVLLFDIFLFLSSSFPFTLKKLYAVVKVRNFNLIQVEVVGCSGLEPPTPTLSGWCSNLLS